MTKFVTNSASGCNIDIGSFNSKCLGLKNLKMRPALVNLPQYWKKKKVFHSSNEHCIATARAAWELVA